MVPFQKANTLRALGQLGTSVVPYLFLWVLMAYVSRISWLLVLPLAVLAAGFFLRIFIVQHDCGHGSFFPNKRANDVVGTLLSLLTATPYHLWKHNHASHHGRSGNLDRRVPGADVYTWTLAEYEAASPRQRARYRFTRNRWVLLLLGPLYLYLIDYRFHRVVGKGNGKTRLSVYGLNLALLATIAAIGPKLFLLVQVPILVLAGAAGVFLFYVQHQFEGVYWADESHFDADRAGLEGSSFLRLNAVLDFFSGHIGYHHIHHLSPRVPNYRLRAAHAAIPAATRPPGISLRAALRGFDLHLWDEGRGELVPFPARLPSAPVPSDK